ncbi:MAG TPA: hypothetical protein VGA46_01405 [Methyloceanibacter sp.]
MFYWIYDLPTWLAMTLFGAAFVGIFWLGAILLSPIVKSWLHRQSDFNATLGNYLGYFGVIYGLLLGLLEIGTYENFTNAEKAVANEAAALLALYRNTASYPEPYRSDFRTLIRDYARTTIGDAWPKQRRGIIPVPGNANPVVGIHHRIAEFEPETRGQQSVHEATLRQFLQTRLERLYSVVSDMPSAMWYVVALGAIFNFAFLWLFDLRRGHHLLPGGMISFFTGTMICLIGLLDNPYRGDGDVSVSPQAFELAYQQMLQD